MSQAKLEGQNPHPLGPRHQVPPMKSQMKSTQLRACHVVFDKQIIVWITCIYGEVSRAWENTQENRQERTHWLHLIRSKIKRQTGLKEWLVLS